MNPYVTHTSPAAAGAAKRLECAQLAAAFGRHGPSKAAASCAHSKRFATFARPKPGRCLRTISALLLVAACAIRAASLPGLQASPQATATNSYAPRTLNTPRDFPEISSRNQWQQRARDVREQILVSCGLWPLPPKTPLQPRIFGRIERDGYSIEKVYFQTWPGFYLAGNLYRPLGRGKGPFPAILNPHGHWKEGRLADTKDGSIPARCISFARQGMIAFSYDMVGFNDTHFAGTPTNRPFYEIHRQFGTNRTDLLWNISPMGLQTWDSIRALDFLESLPDVDPRRLACTGESGGGTQTFILGAVDDRLAAQAPVVMVSHTMQGGCSCENAPGLRVQYSNMEIAAAAAPRPQMLVAATGDWTKDTLTVEGPAIARIYQLLGALDKFHYVRFDYGHNYNQTSREAVYAWFGRWLLKRPALAALAEAPYQKEPDADLRVFPDGQLPADALTQEQFIQTWKQRHRAQWQALAPRTKAGLEKFKQAMLPAWQHTLQLERLTAEPRIQADGLTIAGEFTTAKLCIARAGETDAIQATYWAPSGLRTNRSPMLVVLCDSDLHSFRTAAGVRGVPLSSFGGKGQGRGGSGTGRTLISLGSEISNHTELVHRESSGPSSPQPSPPKEERETPGFSSGVRTGLRLSLLQRGLAVLVVDRFTGGDMPDPFANYYTTYNRTTLQRRVRDLVTICAAADSIEPRKPLHFRVFLCGSHRAGLWALLAAPAADGVIADGAGLDPADEQALLAPDLFCPGLLAIGGFETAALLAAPHPLLWHNAGPACPTEFLRSAYQPAKAKDRLRLEPAHLPDVDLAQWISQWR